MYGAHPLCNFEFITNYKGIWGILPVASAIIKTEVRLDIFLRCSTKIVNHSLVERLILTDLVGDFGSLSLFIATLVYFTRYVGYLFSF